MNYLTVVSELTGISPQKILSKSRIQEISEARQLCMYFYSLQNGISQAGRILKKNHGTVHYGHKRISDLLEIKDRRTIKLIGEIKIKVSMRKEINF